MKKKMKTATTVLVVPLLVLIVAMLWWLGRGPQDAAVSDRLRAEGQDTAPVAAPLRLALVPERDIFAQRKRHRALADYLSLHLRRPVKLFTLNTYQGVLEDFAEQEVDGAFLGSMVAVLAHDRLGARVLVKPEYEGGVSTYHGVVFVREDSPITSPKELAGKSIAAVRATTAGHLFPFYLLVDQGMLRPDNDWRPPVDLRWVGTHDDVIREVVEGRADAGAAKNLRLDAYETANPGQAVRRLATSEPVPTNALVVRRDLEPALVSQLEATLLAMAETPDGQSTLARFGAERFLRCSIHEYRAIYEMVEPLEPAWEKLGVAGPPPKRIMNGPAARPDGGDVSGQTTALQGK